MILRVSSLVSKTQRKTSRLLRGFSAISQDYAAFLDKMQAQLVASQKEFKTELVGAQQASEIRLATSQQASEIRLATSQKEFKIELIASQKEFKTELVGAQQELKSSISKEMHLIAAAGHWKIVIASLGAGATSATLFIYLEGEVTFPWSKSKVKTQN